MQVTRYNPLKGFIGDEQSTTLDVRIFRILEARLPSATEQLNREIPWSMHSVLNIAASYLTQGRSVMRANQKLMFDTAVQKSQYEGWQKCSDASDVADVVLPNSPYAWAARGIFLTHEILRVLLLVRHYHHPPEDTYGDVSLAIRAKVTLRNSARLGYNTWITTSSALAYPFHWAGVAVIRSSQEGLTAGVSTAHTDVNETIQLGAEYIKESVAETPALYAARQEILKQLATAQINIWNAVCEPDKLHQALINPCWYGFQSVELMRELCPDKSLFNLLYYVAYDFAEISCSALTGRLLVRELQGLMNKTKAIACKAKLWPSDLQSIEIRTDGRQIVSAPSLSSPAQEDPPQIPEKKSADDVLLSSQGWALFLITNMCWITYALARRRYKRQG